MDRRRVAIISLVAWFGCTLLPAQTNNSTEYVRNEFRKYLDREPSASELNQWVWSIGKGLDLAELPIALLASEESFNKQGGSANAYISALYGRVLQRSPSRSELSEWVDNYHRFAANRSQLVREFLKAAERERSQPVALPGGQKTSNKNQPLVATARLLEGSLQSELGGTYQGQQALIMARNLVNASRSLEGAIANSSTAYTQAYTDVRTALTALEGNLRDLHFAAPNASAYLNRYVKMFDALGHSVSKPIPLPAPRPNSSSAIATSLYNDVLRETTGLAGDTQKLLYTLRGVANRDAYHNQLLRDVEFFFSQVDTFYHSLRVGMTESDLRHGFLRLRALASGVSDSLREGTPATGIATRWTAVIEDMAQVGAILNIATQPVVNLSQPVLYNAPTYNHLPYQIQYLSPLPARPQPSAGTLQATDEAIANVDAFIVGYNYLVSYSPLVPALQAQARGLKNSLAQFRQEVVQGTSREQLAARIEEMNGIVKSLKIVWEQMVRDARLRNAPDPTGMEQSIQRLSRTFEVGKPLT